MRPYFDMRRARILLLVLLALVLLGIVGAGLSYRSLEEWGKQERKLSETQILEIPRGMSLRALSTKLEELKIISNANIFHYWTKLFSDFSKFQAGKYRFEGATSPHTVARKIISGEIHQPVIMTLTIPEGFTLDQIAARVAELSISTKEEFLELTRNSDILKRYNIIGNTAEGYLYPATYNFIALPSPSELVQQMIETFWKKLPKDYEEHVQKLGLSSLHDAVIFASLIEREAGREDEKTAIAEVIWNRLKRKIPLAIDASLIYGIKDFDGNLRRHHLKDKKNPYNTRVHGGLPPSPICSPSVSALKAILSPTDHGYYYYVLEDKATSRHHFSKTLKEHNKYVRKFVQSGG